MYFIFFSDGGAGVAPNVAGPGVTYPLYLLSQRACCMVFQFLFGLRLQNYFS